MTIFSILNSDLIDLEGTYVNEDLANEYLVRQKNGQLEIAHSRLGVFQLSHIEKLKFAGARMYPFNLEFTEVSGKIAGFKISNNSLRGHYYRKINTLSDQKKMSDLIDKFLLAYNNHNLELLIDCFNSDATIYNFPNEILAKGKSLIGKNYSKLFEKYEEIKCVSSNRIIQRNTVIETLDTYGFDSYHIVKSISVFKIQENLISQLFIINDK